MIISKSLLLHIKKNLISKNYIIVRLCGGLGNQMFQYSLARALSFKDNSIIFLDISSFKGDKKRHYELKKFRNIDSPVLISNYILDRFYIRLLILINSLFFKKSHIKIYDDLFSYKNKIHDNSDNLELIGYWQNEKYFIEFKDCIKRDYLILDEIKTSDELFLKNKILKSNSVAVHVRRGDYVSELDTNNFHGVLSLEYYHKAISKINTLVPDAQFYFFSDDISYVKNQFGNMPCFTYVNISKSMTDFEEMKIMKICKHFIIANSSFSWWAAWLGDFSKKLVICPKVWYSSQPFFDNVCPDSWIRM